MKSIPSSLVLATLLLLPALGEEPKVAAEPTLQSVIIERFVANDATLADVFEAFTILLERASDKNYKPHFVILGEGISAKTVSLNLTKAPLSDALAQIAKQTDVTVTYGRDAVTIGLKKNGAQ